MPAWRPVVIASTAVAAAAAGGVLALRLLAPKAAKISPSERKEKLGEVAEAFAKRFPEVLGLKAP